MDGSALEPRKLRPWYLVAAMIATWVLGVFNASGGCQVIRYLRGADDLAQSADTAEASTPLARTRRVVESTSLQAISKHHRVVFPLSAAKLILGLVLLIASGRALVGRPRSRRLMLQVIAASAVLEVAEFILMAPVRDAVAVAVATDIVENQPDAYQWMTRAEAASLFESVARWSERVRFGGTLVLVYGGAAWALTRERSKAFYLAMEQALAAGQP